ncbi:hypothetical protein DP23_3190 [Ralstonia pickettii]|jgi:hypothetical protein|nr:hypothetical protein DP23_3190 [Ralstonia pickettii]
MLHVSLHEGGRPLSEVRWAGCFRAECGPLCPDGRSLRPMFRCRTAKEKGLQGNAAGKDSGLRRFTSEIRGALCLRQAQAERRTMMSGRDDGKCIEAAAAEPLLV